MRIAKNAETDLRLVARFYASTREDVEKYCTIALSQAATDATFPATRKEQAIYFYRLIRYQSEQQKRFSEMPILIQKHYRYLYTQMLARANKRTGDIDRSEEMVQQAFTKAIEYNNKHGWQATSSDTLKSLSAYLCRIIETLFLDSIRVHDRRKTDSTDEFKSGWATDSTTPEHQTGAELLIQTMRKVLSTDQFNVLNLISQGHSYESAGEVLHMPKSVVHRHVHLGRAKLRKALNEQG